MHATVSESLTVRVEPGMWEVVFEAQSAMTELMGVGLAWPQQVERNLEAMRRRLKREREQQEAREIGMALVRGWREQEQELRRLGLRLPLGAGSGGRQQQRASRQRQAERREATDGGGGGPAS